MVTCDTAVRSGVLPLVLAHAHALVEHTSRHACSLGNCMFSTCAYWPTTMCGASVHCARFQILQRVCPMGKDFQMANWHWQMGSGLPRWNA